jgi:hypothetical protein
MNFADLQSAEWRARAAARVGKKLFGFTHGTPDKAPVLIAGLQRSGTTMLMNIFHMHPDTEVFDEARSSDAFLEFRIRSLDAVRQGIEASHYRFPCFKVIADSHILPSIMQGLPGAKVLWMYRQPGPNAASRLKKWGHATAAIRAVCEGRPGGGWFAEGVSGPVQRHLQALERANFSDFDYACLAWWARNNLYFELSLDQEPSVRLLRYETLVAEPEPTMRALYQWIGMPWSERSMRFVHARSMRKPNLPALDPQVESLCNDLLRRLDDVHARQWQMGRDQIEQPGVAPAARGVASARL